MNKSVLVLLATTTALVMPYAQAQETELTGIELLIKLAALKGIIVTEADLRNPRLRSKLVNDLDLSPNIFASLLRAGDKPISAALATAAVLESATGRRVTVAQAAALIKADPSLAVTTLEEVQEIVENPGEANELVDLTKKPVTPTGRRP